MEARCVRPLLEAVGVVQGLLDIELVCVRNPVLGLGYSNRPDIIRKGSVKNLSCESVRPPLLLIIRGRRIIIVTGFGYYLDRLT